MYCSKCGKLLRDDELFCSSCGTKVVRDEQEIPTVNSEKPVENEAEIVAKTTETAVVNIADMSGEAPTLENNAENKTEESPKPSKSKKPIIIAISAVVIVIILVLLFSGNSSNNANDNTTTKAKTDTVTTTKPTTLSEQEILKKRIKNINEAIIRSLKEDDEYDFLDAEYFGYVNLQDYVKGARSNPDDYFFLGTDMLDFAQSYSNTKFYKNSDVLEYLKTRNMLDADYLFIYRTTKKNAYGKEESETSYVVVRDEAGTKFTQWLIDCHGKDISLDYMILSGIVDKCNYNY